MNHPNIIWEVTSESGSYSDYVQSVLATYRTKEEAEKHMKAIQDFDARFLKLRETLQAELHAKHSDFYASLEECAKTRAHFTPTFPTVTLSVKRPVRPASYDDDCRDMAAALQGFLKKNHDEMEAIGYDYSAEYSVRHTKIFESFETRNAEQAVLDDFVKEHSLDKGSSFP